MKNRKRTVKRKSVLFSLCFVFLLWIAVPVLTPTVEAVKANSDTAPVSPALYVLAEENSMAMAGLKGSSISFEHDDFARAMNLSEISSVTITQTPPVTDGELRVGQTVVNSGQTISAANLSLLQYTAGSADIATSSFRFTVEDSPIEITCHL